MQTRDRRQDAARRQGDPYPDLSSGGTGSGLVKPLDLVTRLQIQKDLHSAVTDMDALLGPLPDQVLQVTRVLLQHPQHGVDNVRLLPFVDVFKLRRGNDKQKAAMSSKQAHKLYRWVQIALPLSSLQCTVKCQHILTL
ncbi:hypothetical protein JZ751_018706 [Albula glossodonta]|uniref:Uncharacterized protein n=1 Tax=Albula glossodonta TaxID=121402 RepID=A0A8T2NLI7_9TELE|nr:hypothetical protein JZ751_018706 [Albula glossodonta]